MAQEDLEYFIIMWSFNGLTLFSNTGVLCFTSRSSQLRKKPSVIYIMNGAIVNVLSSIVFLVPAGHYPDTPTAKVCKVLDYFASFSSNMLVLTVTVISLDKYYAIMKPFMYRNHCKSKNAMYVIVLLWCFSVIFTAPRIISLSLNDYNTQFCIEKSKTKMRQPSAIASDVTTILLVFLLSILICTAYGRLIHRLWLSKMDTQTTDLALLKSRRNIAKLAITSTVFFMLCWLPYCIISGWWIWTATSLPAYIEWLDKHSLIFIIVYTGVSPLLFALHNEAIRRELNRKFSCVRPLNRVSVEPTSNNDG